MESTPKESKNALKGSGLPAVIVTLLACALWVSVGSTLAAPSDDFLSFYTGATLAWQGRFDEIHDPALQLELEKKQFPDLALFRPYIRTSWTAFWLSPMSLLPVDSAFRAWIGWHILLLVLSCIWAVWRFGWDALFFVCLNYPVGSGIIHGQDATGMLILAVAGYALAEKGRDFWAGSVLGLGLVKFHLWTVFLPAMLLHRRSKMALGYLATAVFMATTCLVLGGPAGIVAYVRLLLRDDIKMLSPGPHTMMNVQAIQSNFDLGSPWISVPVMLIMCCIVFVGLRNAPLWKWFTVASGGSLVLAPHIYSYDATLFVLPLWLIFFHARRPVTRMLAALFSTPLPYFASVGGMPWTAVPACILLLVVIAVAFERNSEDPAPAAEPEAAAAPA